MERKTLVFLCLLVIGLMVASAVPVGAAKGGVPGAPDDGGDDDEGGGTSPSGTIYYLGDQHDDGRFWTMDGDGDNKQPLSFFKGQISLTKHDGHYWHVYFETLDATLPGGVHETQLRAIRDDGEMDHLLWYDEDMAYDEDAGPVCWMTDDAHISWVWWKISEDGTVSDQGVYKAEVFWDGVDPPSLGTPWKAYAVGTWHDDYLDTDRAAASCPNWSADGSKLIYSDWNGGKVLVDFSGPGDPSVTTFDYIGNHAISPDGTKMFIADGGDNIVVMDIDGDNSETIYSVEAKRNSDINFGWMYWSPDSNYIVFTQYVFHSQDLSFSGDIYTIGADGSDNSKLTKKTQTCDWFIPLAWR